MAITGGLDWENAMQPLPLGVSKVSNLRGEVEEIFNLLQRLYPRKPTWNPKIGGLYMFLLLSLGGIFRFHVNFQGVYPPGN